ncbi:MAG: GDSL-type esterase/lipase family protein [Acetobacteraceae bacterium]
MTLKLWRIGLILAVFLGVLPAAPIAVARVNLAAAPISRMDLPWWRTRFEQKAALLHSQKIDLVWYGDSITENFEHHGPPAWQNFAPIWQRFYGGRHAINLGFVGDSTANLIWRIDHGEASGISPKVAVVLIGANNFGLPHWPARETVPGIEEVVRLLRAHLPHTAIVLLSVLPSRRSAWVSENTRLTNAALAGRYANSRAVHYIDLTNIFMRAGKLDPSLFLDRFFSPPEPLLHPTPAAQAMICARIEPTIALLMGDPSRILTH